METTSGEGLLQFGQAEDGVAYRDRAASFGVAADVQGRIAVVKVTHPEATWFDLPGGGIEPGEGEAQAVVREFGEETGFKVRPGRLLARAGQFMRLTTGEPVNNRSGVYEVEVTGEDAGLKVEADHELQWLNPLDAITRMRHDSHAWAVAAWLRRRGRG